ncbi:hypothetical protein M975_2273 [Buttiauxella brennerae ATCC 51605]|uniref:Uncharacterized protein n=1 Tax=Buttiauxella brennerae ATCC 51605 TaxID=1354251 RepID=A0A1B7INT7_9ENTR|nr:hypothetical protein M975_2273 [Buttiauxella brennerae ATCC 51605]
MKRADSNVGFFFVSPLRLNYDQQADQQAKDLLKAITLAK